jgi:hypothetical protein
VLTGRTNGGLQQVDISTGSVRRTIPSRFESANGIEVSRSGRYVRVWEDDLGLTSGEVWSVATGELLGLMPLCLPSRCSVLDPAETRMAIPGADSLMRIWDLEQRRVLLMLPIQAIAWSWSSDGNRLRVIRSDIEIEEFDGSPWKPGEAKEARVPFTDVTLARLKAK